MIVVALAEMMVAHAALCIDEIVRRPVLIFERTPDRIFVIDGDRVGDVQIGDGAPHIGHLLFEGKLRRVHADHHEPLVLVLLGPGTDIGNGPQAVDAGIGPEIHQHHLALQALGGQRRRVQPFDGAGE
jgi:hypothetical protein